MTKKTLYGISCTLLILISLCVYQSAISSMIFFRGPAKNFTSYPPEVESFLKKPLHFIGMGSQCIAFSSEEESYVLKVCKANRYQIPAFLENPLVSFFCNHYLRAKQLRKQEKQNSDFLNYRLSYEKAKKESGIVFLHLEKTIKQSAPIHLKDPFGITHSFSQDDLLFYVQKKAKPLAPYLIDLLHQNKNEELTTFFSNLLHMVEENRKNGIFIKDINPKKNIGVCENLPMWIDPGRIIQATLNPDNALELFSKEFTPFLASLDKDLSPLFEKAKTKIKNSFYSP